MITIVFAVLAWFLLVSSFDDCKFLNADEKSFMTQRLKYDFVGADRTRPFHLDDSFKAKYVKQAFTDWNVWLSTFTYILEVVPLYSIALALPGILSTGLGYSRVESQLLTVPVYSVAAVLTISVAYMSDRIKNRSGFLIAGVTLSLIGWVMQYATPNARVRYGGVFLSAAGTYSAFPCVVSLLSQNLGGRTKKATGMAIQIGLGNLAGIASSFIFPSRDSPRYLNGSAICISLNAGCIVSCLINVWLLRRANEKKRRLQESGEMDKYSEEELSTWGDRHPRMSFLY